MQGCGADKCQDPDKIQDPGSTGSWIHGSYGYWTLKGFVDGSYGSRDPD